MNNSLRAIILDFDGTIAETEEELARFGRAVLLAGAPIPHLEDSRYRSRIYRGMAITV